MRIFIKKLKSLIKDFAHPFFWARLSYAQEGEDLVVDRLLGPVKDGFYIEVGAHDPFRFSNTFFFYRRKWRGICIDPIPGAAARFRRWRPRDIFVEMAVASKPSSLTYYMFNDGALNTFDPNKAKEIIDQGKWSLVGTQVVKTDTLANICSKNNVPHKIDLMSIDVEGLDLQVLQSHDWQLFRPKIVIVEVDELTFANLLNDKIVTFLSSQGFKPISKTGKSLIFL